MELCASGLTKTFGKRGVGPAVMAVDNVSLTIRPGDFTAVVGESGSGKSTVARMLLGLVPPSSGTVTFNGRNLADMNRAQMMEYRSAVQCVLQDPSAALNPRNTVRTILSEVIRLHGLARRKADVLEKVREALEIVDLKPAEHFLERYPHQLSGGQRQRVLIARAVILKPSIIIADEAVSALDVSVKAGIINLLNTLRSELNIGYLFITHDLPVVKKVADFVYVMKSGKVVEKAPKSQLFSAPGTDYTRELLAAAPVPDPARAKDWIRSAS